MIRQENVKIKKNHHIGCWFVLIVLLAVIAGVGTYCYNIYKEKRDFDAGEQRAWLAIERYDGKDQLDSLVASLHRYQKHYPNGRHADQVLNICLRVDSERRDWKQVRHNVTLENLEEFIRQHSDGYYRDEASRMIDSLLYLEAKTADTYKAYRNYIQTYENGIYAARAKARMMELLKGCVGRGEAIEVENTLNQHFRALAENDREMLLSTVSRALGTYVGKTDATRADIVKYMLSIHETAGRQVAFELSNLSIAKLVDEHTLHYNVAFSFDESVFVDGEETMRSFNATAILDFNYLICSLNFKAK